MKKLLACLLVAVLVVTSMMPTMKAEAAMTATVESEAQLWYNQTMLTMQDRIENGIDGNDLPYSYHWYSAVYSSDIEVDTGDVELLARFIYAAAPYWKADKQCLALMVWNGDLIYKLTSTRGEFPQLTGDADETEKARVVDITSADWQNALTYASYIYAAEMINGNPRSLFEVCNYSSTSSVENFGSQTKFLTYDEFFEYGTDEDTLPYLVIDNEWIEIKDIYIPLMGTCKNTTLAYTEYSISTSSSDSRPSNLPGDTVNLYYSMDDEKY